MLLDIRMVIRFTREIIKIAKRVGSECLGRIQIFGVDLDSRFFDREVETL